MTKISRFTLTGLLLTSLIGNTALTQEASLVPIIDLVLNSEPAQEPFSCELSIASLTNPVNSTIPLASNYGARIRYDIRNRPPNHSVTVFALVVNQVDENISNGMILGSFSEVVTFSSIESNVADEQDFTRFNNSNIPLVLNRLTAVCTTSRLATDEEVSQGFYTADARVDTTSITAIINTDQEVNWTLQSTD